MKRDWEKKEAIDYLTNNGGEVEVKVKTKVIKVTKLSGLKACGALDYLVKHCGYMAR